MTTPSTALSRTSGLGAEGDNILEKITGRQTEIVILYGQGKSYSEIARALNISRHTVDSHLRRAKERAGCNSRVKMACDVAVAMTKRGG
jgi:DNA-binding CsgD family transcriptional regulator